MAREKQETMDELAATHRDAIINLRQRHSESMSRKDALLKESDELVQGFQDMFRELLNEMRGTKVARRKADELSKRAAQVHSRYLEQKLLNDSLTDEIIDTRATSIDLRTKIEEYEAMIDYLYDELDSQKSDFDSIVHFIDSYYQEELESLTPKHICKHCVPNSSGKGNVICMHCYHNHMFLLSCHLSVGVHVEWMPHVNKLILEMLSNRTPPTYTQANIFAAAKALHPDIDVVKELPSLKHIKNLWTTLLFVSRTLAAFQIGNARLLKQLHTDGTHRRQTSLVNVVVSFLAENDELKTICLDGAIIAEDSTAEQQLRSILASFTESSRLLKKWRHETECMFPNRSDLLEAIPDPSSVDITHILGGMISHDNCNTA